MNPITHNILTYYVRWHFFEMPKEILRGWKNYLKFFAYFFSIPILIKSYFAPWKKISWTYGRGFSPTRFLETAVSNVFLRILGAFLRSIIIFFGIFFEIIIFFLGAILFLFWIFLPIILIFLFVSSFKFLFS